MFVTTRLQFYARSDDFLKVLLLALLRRALPVPSPSHSVEEQLQNEPSILCGGQAFIYCPGTRSVQSSN